MDPGELQDALLTMDVVDQLRYRNAEMKALADSGHDRAGLKRRLQELYRSQGIEVTDEILEAGIDAQREQRYLYVAPAGFKAWLARRWIDRRRLLAWAAGLAAALLLITVLALLARSVGAMAQEDARQKNIRALNDKVDAQERAVAAARGLLGKQEQRLQGVLPRAAASGDRLQAQVDSVQTALADAHRRFDAIPGQATGTPLPVLVRKDEVTRSSGGDALTGAQAAASVEQQRLDAEQALNHAREALATVTERMTTLLAAVDSSEQLESSNSAAKAAALSDEAERARQRAYTAGDAALRAGDNAAAGQAVATLKGLVGSAAKLAGLREQLAQLKADGLATGVAGEDRQRFERALDRAATLARVDTLDQAEPALQDVARLVAVLSDTLSYRIVNRDNERTGVWRYSEKANGGRNYYLVVEALDEAGSATAMTVRNEETGVEELASLFAVRVPKGTYDRVAADKQDNGIIEDDLIGSKPRGSLSPRFRMPTIGGYITEW